MMSNAGQEPVDDPRIEVDCTRMLYRQGPSASLIAVVIGACVLIGLWGHVSATALITWYALVWLNQTVRIALWYGFRRSASDATQTPVWARRYMWNMAFGGTLFGSMTVFMFAAGAPLQQMLLLNIIAGLAAGSIAVNAYHPRSMIAYLLLILLPTFFRLLSQDGLEYGLLSFTWGFYVLLLLAFGRNQAALIRESFVIRYQNLDLIGELSEKRDLAEAAQRKAERANFAKSQFFTAASHDLRQPLHALGFFAASLRDAERGHGNAETVDQILSSIDALESLFDELLDISKLEAGYIKPNAVHFQAASLFKKLAALYAAVALKNGLRLRFVPTGATLLTDPLLLERVLSNLVSNALRYTKRGGVTVACRRRGDDIAVEVWDTGIGIPDDQCEAVFDEFYQLGNPERDRKKGLGLGLATVRRIADLLGHRIELKSRVGRGTVFRLFVPMGNPRAVASPPPPAQESEINLLKGTTIAVIEDERSVREGMVSLFTQWGCRVVATASAEEGASALAESGLKPDAIIADYRLREHHTGIEAIHALRKQFGEAIPALLVSGDTSPELFREARQHEITLLNKPVRAARIRAALLHLLVSNLGR